MVQTIEGSRGHLNFEHARIVEHCLEPVSIAEIAAQLEMPLGVAMVLVGDLVAQERLEVSHSDPIEIELSTLTRMIDRVRALNRGRAAAWSASTARPPRPATTGRARVSSVKLVVAGVRRGKDDVRLAVSEIPPLTTEA